MATLGMNNNLLDLLSTNPVVSFNTDNTGGSVLPRDIQKIRIRIVVIIRVANENLEVVYLN